MQEYGSTSGVSTPIAYELFKEICKKYRKGKVTDQHALPKDTKGMPAAGKFVAHVLIGTAWSPKQMMHKIASQ